jgi:hypothetical protein
LFASKNDIRDTSADETWTGAGCHHTSPIAL